MCIQLAFVLHNNFELNDMTRKTWKILKFQENMNQTPWTESSIIKKTRPITSTKTIYFSITITMVLPDQNPISLIYWAVHFVSLCFCKWIDNGACVLTHTVWTCSQCNQYGVCCFFSTSFSLASSSFTTYYCNPDLTSRDDNICTSIDFDPHNEAIVSWSNAKRCICI